MTVRVLPVVVISCDWPDCEAEESFAPGTLSATHAAARLARRQGWTVANGNQRKPTRSARCPEHRHRTIHDEVIQEASRESVDRAASIQEREWVEVNRPR